MLNDDASLVEILLVEDNPGDVVLTREALAEAKVRNRLYVAEDGVVAMAMLRKEGEYTGVPTPDLILLDLNLPLKDGRQVLAEIKGDARLGSIPVVILTSSMAEEDIVKSYQLNANCFITKPVDLDSFLKIVRLIDDFWLGVVKLPPKD